MIAESLTEQSDLDILVVEDSPTVGLIVKRCFKEWGYPYQLLTDGRQAWEYLQDHIPAVLMLDWNLPGMTGLEICRRVRRLNNSFYSYIIILTGKDNSEDIITGFEAGADDYIVKPFDKGVLHARLKVGQRIIALEQNQTQKTNELREANSVQQRLIRELENLQRMAEARSDQLQLAQAQIAENAHRAGMAEVATNVLHNIGNLLNTSVTTTDKLIEARTKSKIATLDRLANLLSEHHEGLPLLCVMILRGSACLNLS